MERTCSVLGRPNVTCHRAFDMTRDLFPALEALIRCGAGRVLTSGQRDKAIEGAGLLAEFVQRVGERIIILRCDALDPNTIGSVQAATGLHELYVAALRDIPSSMVFRNPRDGMGVPILTANTD